LQKLWLLLRHRNFLLTMAAGVMVSTRLGHRGSRTLRWPRIPAVVAAWGAAALALSSSSLTLRGLPPRAYSAPAMQIAPTPMIPDGVDPQQLHERLARRVKKLQRSSPTAFRRWKQVCREAGYMGRLNPHEHTVEFLQHYLNGDFSDDADDDDIEEVEEDKVKYEVS